MDVGIPATRTRSPGGRSGREGPEVVSGLLTHADGQVLTHHVSALGAAFTRLLAPSSPSVHAFWVLSGREH